MAEKQDLLSRTAGRLMLALTLALAVLVLGPAAAALAQPPQLTIEFPEGSPTNNPTPQLQGTTDDSFDEVTVVIERVGGGGGVTLKIAPVGEEWSISPGGEPARRGIHRSRLSDERAGRSRPERIGGVHGRHQPPDGDARTASPRRRTTPNRPSAVRRATAPRSWCASTTPGRAKSRAPAGGRGGSWTAGNESSLPTGTYTARAEQTDARRQHR